MSSDEFGRKVRGKYDGPKINDYDKFCKYSSVVQDTYMLDSCLFLSLLQCLSLVGCYEGFLVEWFVFLVSTVLWCKTPTCWTLVCSCLCCSVCLWLAVVKVSLLSGLCFLICLICFVLFSAVMCVC